MKQGDKVVCISGIGWNQYWYFFGRAFKKPWKYKGPQKDQIYSVADIAYHTIHLIYVINLKEFPGHYYSINDFRKVDYTFADQILQETIEEIKKTYIAK